MNYSSGQSEQTDMSAKYSISPGVILTTIGIHTFLVTAVGFMEMNESAVFYWRCIEKGLSGNDFINLINERYEIDDPTILKRDIEQFIHTCLIKHLVKKDVEENGTYPDSIS